MRKILDLHRLIDVCSVEFHLCARLLLNRDATTVRLFNTGCYVIVLHSIEITQRILTHLLLDHCNFLFVVLTTTSCEMRRLINRGSWLRGSNLSLRLRLVQYLLGPWLVTMLRDNFWLRNLLLKGISPVHHRLRPILLWIWVVPCSRNQVLLETFLLNSNTLSCSLRYKQSI